MFDENYIERSDVFMSVSIPYGNASNAAMSSCRYPFRMEVLPTLIQHGEATLQQREQCCSKKSSVWLKISDRQLDQVQGRARA